MKIIEFRDVMDCKVAVLASSIYGVCIPSVFKSNTSSAVIFVGPVNYTVSCAETERIKEEWLKFGNLNQ